MINLLPQEQKSALYARLLQKQMIYFGLLIIAVLCGGAFFIFNTYVFLKIQTDELKNTLNLEESGNGTRLIKDYDEMSGKFISMVKKYHGFKADKKSVVDIFTKLQDVLPKGSKLRTFSFNETSKKISISGQAQNRDEILLLENNLKKDETFIKLESPLDNFLEKTNPNFNFIFYLKDDAK